MKPYHHEITLRTCHDVRKLAACAHCKGLGKFAAMVSVGSRKQHEYLHGRCFIKQAGMEAFLRLPTKTLESLYLGDIGAEAMKAISDELAERTSRTQRGMICPTQDRAADKEKT